MKLGAVARGYNPRVQVAEAGRSQIQDQPGLNSETLPQKKKKEI
jgi:hypothetical protein